MIILMSFLIPFIFIGIAKIIHPHKITLLEFFIPIVLSIILMYSIKAIDKQYLISDTEYLSDVIISAHYEEAWNEYISQTCSTTTCSGSGKDEICVTTYYDCSYVDYHREKYYLRDNSKNEYNITKKEYKQYIKFWNVELFQDLNRHFYSIDGNMFYTQWDGSFNKIKVAHRKNTYDNKIQTSHSIYNYEEIDEDKAKKLKLYDYPKINGYTQKPILTKEYIHDSLQTNFNKINGLLGRKKQIQVYLLLWKNKPKDISYYQKAYWKGGNKNELIINVGLNNKNEITWTNVYSWSDKKLCEIKIRKFISHNIGHELNINELIPIVYTNIDKHWVRKEFHDFDYIDIKLTNIQIIWLYVIIFIVSIITTIIVTMNKFENSNSSKSKSNIHYFINNFKNKINLFKNKI